MPWGNHRCEVLPVQSRWMALDLQRWRAEFPHAGERIYLNHASEGPLPGSSVLALEAAAGRKAAPWNLTLDDYFGNPRRCRDKIAKLIGAQESEIALTPSCTYAVNVVAAALAESLPPGSEVVIWRGEFPANVQPWLNQRRGGLDVRLAGSPLRYPSLEAVTEELSDSTRVLALSWVSFTTGFRIDLAALGRLCRERGIFLLVDGVQGVGALEIDLGSLEVDALACSGHKWLLSPAGTGFLYVRRERMEELPPPFVGWLPFLRSRDFSRASDLEHELPGDATRYETGTPSNVLLCALEASLDLILETGVEAIEARLRELNAAFVEALPEGWRLVSPVGVDEPHASGIVSLRRNGVDPLSAAKALHRAGAYAIVREGLLRISPHVYITREEMIRAARALAEVPTPEEP